MTAAPSDLGVRVRHALRPTVLRGVLVAAMIGAAATFLANSYDAPVMLFALLIGMAFHFLAENDTCADGIDVASKTLLRLGVGLMGLRLAIEDVLLLGWAPILTVLGLVTATLSFGALLSFLFGRRLGFGMLAGGSVAICGASAALAIASVLPRSPGRDQDTLFVVMGVTVLSTVAMIAYPLLFRTLGLDDLEAAFLIGATIHDVAQVVGAGYSISDEAGVLATFIKMLRVALLPVVILFVILFFRDANGPRAGLPWFLVMFVVLVLVGNLGVIPDPVVQQANAASRWFLVIAISALGVKTSLAQILQVDRRYVSILVLSTLALLGMGLAVVPVLAIG